MSVSQTNCRKNLLWVPWLFLLILSAHFPNGNLSCYVLCWLPVSSLVFYWIFKQELSLCSLFWLLVNHAFIVFYPHQKRSGFLKIVKYLSWNSFQWYGPPWGFPGVTSCMLKASHLHTNAIRRLVFQIPKEPNCPLAGYPPEYGQTPTWNADGTCASKFSWVTPGCRVSVSAKRYPGPSDFTCKFGVDIAFKTAFLAGINFWKLPDFTVGLQSAFLVICSTSVLVSACKSAGPQAWWPARSLRPVESLPVISEFSPLSSSSAIQM